MAGSVDPSEKVEKPAQDCQKYSFSGGCVAPKYSGMMPELRERLLSCRFAAVAPHDSKVGCDFSSRDRREGSLSFESSVPEWTGHPCDSTGTRRS